jgi:Methyltransferase domain
VNGGPVDGGSVAGGAVVDAIGRGGGEDDVPLLLHAVATLREVWLPLFEAADVRGVVEVGAERGVTTSVLVDALRRRGGGRLAVVDPSPGAIPEPGGGVDVTVVRGYSPEALADLPPADLYVLDGDHNYATMTGELATIAGAAGADDPAGLFPLVVIHDVGWPAGRRDQYYTPDRIAVADRHPYTWDMGVRRGDPGVVDGGFHGEGEFAWATVEGGPGNGVLTAVEDFVASRPWLAVRLVPAIFGLAVMVDQRAPWAARVGSLLEPWVGNELLARLEANRLDLYLRVLRLQEENAKLSRARQRDLARLDVERAALDERELGTLDRVGELERALTEERRTSAALRADLTARPEPGTFRSSLLRRR